MSLRRFVFVLSGASFAVSFGTCKLLAQLFLGTWQVGSSGGPDIVARGPFLLGLFLPEFAVIAIVTATLTGVTAARRVGRSLWGGGGVGFVAGAAGVAPIWLGVDPTALALNVVPWPTPLMYFSASAMVAFLIGLLGLRASHSLVTSPAAPDLRPSN